MRLKETGCLPAKVNVTTRTKEWSRGLSPFLLGPVDTYQEEGKMLTAVSVEVAWQYSKIYSHENVDGKLVPLNFQKPDGMPNREWFAWRNRAWRNPRFHWDDSRFDSNKKLLRRAFPKGSTVAAWYWDGRLMDAVTARRKIYATLYCNAVRQSPAYQQLLDLYAKGDVAVFDLDGYDYVALAMSAEDTIHEINHSWGHGLLLTLMLNGIDPTLLGKTNRPVENCLNSGYSPIESSPTAHLLSIGSLTSSHQNNIMNTFQQIRASIKLQRTEAKKREIEVKNDEALYKRIEKIVKKAGFGDLSAYLEKIGYAAKTAPLEETPIAAKPAKVNPAKAKASKVKSKTGIKRTPISDAKLAKMKALRDKGVSHEKIAKQLKVSPQSVYNWQKKGFKR